MYLYSRKRGAIYNLNQVADIFIGRQGNTVSLGLNDGRTLVFEEYSTEALAREAVYMLAETIGHGKINVFAMPEESEVQQRLNNKYPDPEKYGISGKKTKGHGGS